MQRNTADEGWKKGNGIGGGCGVAARSGGVRCEMCEGESSGNARRKLFAPLQMGDGSEMRIRLVFRICGSICCFGRF